MSDSGTSHTSITWFVMPLMPKKLKGHIGFRLSVRLRVRVDECILVCYFLSSIYTWASFFSACLDTQAD